MTFDSLFVAMRSEFSYLQHMLHCMLHIFQSLKFVSVLNSMDNE